MWGIGHFKHFKKKSFCKTELAEIFDYSDTSVIALPRALSPEQIATAVQQALWKAEEKRLSYMPLPHSSTRWRMIAGNVMLKMVSESSLR